MQQTESKIKTRQRRPLTHKEKAYLLLLLPGLIMMFLFKYVPMAGLVMAFQNFSPVKGFFKSPFVGLKNFQNALRLPNFTQVVGNTFFLASFNIVLGILVPLVFSLMLNEVRSAKLKRSIQTVVYLPHFLSWVILAFTFKQLFSANGIVNQLVRMMGGDTISFFANNAWFRTILIVTGQWKEFGWGTIIFISAILSIDPNLYEAAAIDGATRFQRMLHVTLPGMAPIIVLRITLSLGSVLESNFDQIFNMYNSLVYEGADVIDTYVYRLGMINLQYSLSSAIGLFRSFVSLILIAVSYRLADRLTGYKIF